jgi:hypothetical protein
MTSTETPDAPAAASSRPRRARRPKAPAQVDGIVRRNYGLGHGYKVDGRKFPGVTTISGMIKSEGLMGHSGKATARYAVNNWGDLAELPYGDRLEELYKAGWSERDEAAGRGTEIHALGAALAAGHEVHPPEDLWGHVNSYRRWLDYVDPELVATEVVVANRAVRYCGTADLVADLPAMRLFGAGSYIAAGRWLLDLKSGRSGVWPEHAVQLCGYRWAEVYVAADGTERPVADLGIEYTGVVRVTADGAELVYLETGPEVWAYFRALCEAWWAGEDRREWVGPTAAPAEMRRS